jgi:hypothetical protein
VAIVSIAVVREEEKEAIQKRQAKATEDNLPFQEEHVDDAQDMGEREQGDEEGQEEMVHEHIVQDAPRDQLLVADSVSHRRSREREKRWREGEGSRRVECEVSSHDLMKELESKLMFIVVESDPIASPREETAAEMKAKVVTRNNSQNEIQELSQQKELEVCHLRKKKQKFVLSLFMNLCEGRWVDLDMPAW